MTNTTGKNRNWMTAITFAEAGEWDTAREMMPISRANSKISRLQKIFMAVTFAEEGLHQEARHILDGRSSVPHVKICFLDTVGLGGVQVTFGLMPAEVPVS